MEWLAVVLECCELPLFVLVVATSHCRTAVMGREDATGVQYMLGRQ